MLEEEPFLIDMHVFLIKKLEMVISRYQKLLEIIIQGLIYMILYYQKKQF